MTAVVDEYGGTAGMLTSSQVVEEIVGELGDELAGRVKEFEIIDDRTFQVDGAMRIEDVNEQMELELPEGDYETVAGFVLSLLGRIPREGEQVKYRDIRIAVVSMRGVKIEKVLVTKEDVAPVTP
jgi:putative hemolysin